MKTHKTLMGIALAALLALLLTGCTYRSYGPGPRGPHPSEYRVPAKHKKPKKPKKQKAPKHHKHDKHHHHR